MSLPGTALLVIDVQNDFLSGGALAVPGGEAVIPFCNALASAPYRRNLALVVSTQDWHPATHVSFASNHPGKSAFVDSVDVSWDGQTLKQQLWPVHCVQDTPGAALHKDLALGPANSEKDGYVVVQKGYHEARDSYSAFSDAFDFEQTNLGALLGWNGVERCIVVGLAEDYCVFHTALDAARLGYETLVVKDAVRGIADFDADKMKQYADMGVRVVAFDSDEINAYKMPS